MKKFFNFWAFAFFALLCLIASQAYAYIGPGLGVAFIWVLLGPIAALAISVAMIAYFPARYYYKKWKKGKSHKTKDESETKISRKNTSVDAEGEQKPQK